VALAPRTALLAAHFVEGQCKPVHAFSAAQPLASASTFKLFILGELTRQVESSAVARISSRPTFAPPLAERRRTLAEEIDTVPLSVFETLPDETAPEEIERLEWVFTREVLCRATAALHEMTRQPGCCP
jgi:hypothetical protein